MVETTSRKTRLTHFWSP